MNEDNSPPQVEQDASKAWARARKRATWVWVVVSVWSPVAIIVGWDHWNGWVRMIAVIAAGLPLVAAWLLTEQVEKRAKEWATIAREANTKKVAVAFEKVREVAGSVGVVLWKAGLLLVGDFAWLVGLLGAGGIFGMNPPLGTEAFCLLGLARVWTSRIRVQS